jgi:hypothetical protein
VKRIMPDPYFSKPVNKADYLLLKDIIETTVSALKMLHIIDIPAYERTAQLIMAQLSAELGPHLSGDNELLGIAFSKILAHRRKEDEIKASAVKHGNKFDMN